MTSFISISKIKKSRKQKNGRMVCDTNYKIIYFIIDAFRNICITRLGVIMQSIVQ